MVAPKELLGQLVGGLGGKARRFADNITWTGTHEFDSTVNFDGAVDFDSTVDLSGATTTYEAGSIDNAAISASAAIARSKLAQDNLKPFGIPLHTLRAADMAALGVSETAGDHYIVVDTNKQILRGEVADNETEVSVSLFQFVLPPEYVDGETITVSINAKWTVVGAGGTDSGAASTIDLEARKVTKATGAVGSDIVATAAQTLTNTGTEFDFTVTPTGLVAGDVLNFKLTTSVVEDDGSTGTIQAEIFSIAVKCDVKG